VSPGPYGRLAGRQQLRPTSQSNGGLSVPVAATFPPFNPLERITWAAAFWASDPLWANPGDGSRVSEWRDGSGNGRNVSQATAGNRPLYVANHPQLNNQPAIEFLNTRPDRLTSSSFTAVAQPNTWVAVFRFTGATDTNEQMRLVDNNGIGASRQLMGGRNSTEYVGNAGSPGVLTRAPNTEPSVMVWYANGASSWVQVNGQRSGSVNSGANGVTGVGIGSDGGVSRLTASVAFIGLYSGDLTNDAQWTAFSTWAIHTYAIKG
jgi:hypothetical protein